MVGKRKQRKTGKLCLFELPALNYAIYRDANVLNINILVENAYTQYTCANKTAPRKKNRVAS